MDVIDGMDTVDVVEEARTFTDIHGRTRTHTDFMDGIDVMDRVDMVG